MGQMTQWTPDKGQMRKPQWSGVGRVWSLCSVLEHSSVFRIRNHISLARLATSQHPDLLCVPLQRGLLSESVPSSPSLHLLNLHSISTPSTLPRYFTHKCQPSRYSPGLEHTAHFPTRVMKERMWWPNRIIPEVQTNFSSLERHLALRLI